LRRLLGFPRRHWWHALLRVLRKLTAKTRHSTSRVGARVCAALYRSRWDLNRHHIQCSRGRRAPASDRTSSARHHTTVVRSRIKRWRLYSHFWQGQSNDDVPATVGFLSVSSTQQDLKVPRLIY
jgi:hypothetical protein